MMRALSVTGWRSTPLSRRRCPWRRAASNRGVNFLEWAGQLVPQGPVVSGVKQAWKLTWLTLMRELAPQSDTGAFVRARYGFHRDIGSDPSLPVEKGRYHVYVGNACPWCHRILLGIAVLGLEDWISFSQVQDDPERASRGGWIFDPSPDPITGARDLKAVYDMCSGESAGYQGRCTAPLLIDKKKKRIVSNESSLMLKNLNSLEVEGGTRVDLRPAELQERIDELNSRIYESVNNGVYKCGFATSQEAYNAASVALFSELDRLNTMLSSSRFLLGSKFTECDLRLFPTLMRFDPIYSTVFRCSRRRFHEYPHLQRWLQDVYWIHIPSSTLQIADTLDVEDARRSYCELFPLNPSGIVYDGPSLGLDVTGHTAPDDMDSIFYKKQPAGLVSSDMGGS